MKVEIELPDSFAPLLHKKSIEELTVAFEIALTAPNLFITLRKSGAEISTAVDILYETRKLLGEVNKRIYESTVVRAPDPMVDVIPSTAVSSEALDQLKALSQEDDEDSEDDGTGFDALRDFMMNM